MKILVDGSEVRKIECGADEVVAAYRRTVTELAENGRTVVKVLADGEELDGDRQERMLKGQSLPERMLAFESVDTRELASSTLTEVLKHFGPLREALEATTEALGRNERTQAFQALQPALEVWLAASQAAHQVMVLAGFAEGGETVVGFHDVQHKTLVVFGDVRATLQQEDWVKLNDLVEYEMMPLVDRWESLVESLLNSLRSDSQA